MAPFSRAIISSSLPDLIRQSRKPLIQRHNSPHNTAFDWAKEDPRVKHEDDDIMLVKPLVRAGLTAFPPSITTAMN